MHQPRLYPHGAAKSRSSEQITLDINRPTLARDDHSVGSYALEVIGRAKKGAISKWKTNRCMGGPSNLS